VDEELALSPPVVAHPARRSTSPLSSALATAALALTPPLAAASSNTTAALASKLAAAAACLAGAGPCVPGPAQYSNYPAFMSSSANNLASTVWISCQGPFALCFQAKCTPPLAGSKPSQAACGCVDGATTGVTPVGSSVIQPSFMLNQPAALANSAVCYSGLDPAVAGTTPGTPTPCAVPPAGTTNAAPVCALVAKEGALYGPKWPLVSTFQASPSQATVACTGAADGLSAYANCMTAACERTPGPGGAPLTCYCPVTRVAPGAPFILSYDGPANPGGPPPGLCASTRLDGGVLSGSPVVV
jgi:hypothetical protein